MPVLSHHRNHEDKLDNTGHHEDDGVTDYLTLRMPPHSVSQEESHHSVQPYCSGDDIAKHQVAAQYWAHYDSAMDPVYTAALAYQNTKYRHTVLYPPRL